MSELGASDKPVIEALNKCDLLEDGAVLEPADAILISAASGLGLDRLREAIARGIAQVRHPVELLIPYNKGAVLSLIHKKGQVDSEEYTDSGTLVTCRMDPLLYARVQKELAQDT
ncbi:MAG: hypothetical protein II697_06390 [Clostridia bacterium]|nr:hypothetical protein [Clostridia bacterium]